jgi:hypothetical protein
MGIINNLFKKSLKKNNEGQLCNCDTHYLVDYNDFTFELKNGQFTQYFLIKCRTCRGFYALPYENMILTLENGSNDTMKRLIQIGFNKTFLEEYVLKGF